MRHWCRTYTGAQVFFDKPEDSTITFLDIAHQLANLSRFTGASNSPYSIAQHSVLVAYHCPENAWEGLMHDASEAFLNDIPKPLKVLLPDYQKIEDRFSVWLSERFKFQYPFPDEVHTADLRLLATEMRSMMAQSDHESLKCLPFNYKIRPVSHIKARKLFLSAFEDIRKKKRVSEDIFLLALGE